MKIISRTVISDNVEHRVYDNGLESLYSITYLDNPNFEINYEENNKTPKMQQLETSYNDLRNNIKKYQCKNSILNQLNL